MKKKLNSTASWLIVMLAISTLTLHASWRQKCGTEEKTNQTCAGATGFTCPDVPTCVKGSIWTSCKGPSSEHGTIQVDCTHDSGAECSKSFPKCE